MCKILVISDVHGRLRDLRWVLQNETADAMFFLGDGLYDLNAALELRREPVPYPIYRVAGNCDVNYSEPSEGLAPFGGVLFFYTHGHHYGVKMGSERLAECAGERGADVALFGHTHRRELVRGVGTAATVEKTRRHARRLGSLGSSSRFRCAPQHAGFPPSSHPKSSAPE